MSGWGVSPDFWQGLALATVIAVLAALRLKHYRADEYPQMGWMDWCGHFALVGVFTILLSAVVGWPPLTLAGLLLLFPLYPIAVLGLLGKLDDARVTLLRAWRER